MHPLCHSPGDWTSSGPGDFISLLTSFSPFIAAAVKHTHPAALTNQTGVVMLILSMLEGDLYGLMLELRAAARNNDRHSALKAELTMPLPN